MSQSFLSELDVLHDKVKMYIPNLLDVFCSTLVSGKSSASESTRVIRLKNSIAQDIVYCVSGGKMETPKSGLFPGVVKSLCNNVELIKLINNYGHGVSYNLIEEIETEHALIVINEQKEKKVIIPKEAFQDDGSCCVGLTVADDISQPTKRKCLRSLPADAVLRETPEYYTSKRTGPGELKHICDLDKSRKCTEHNYHQKMSLDRSQKAQDTSSLACFWMDRLSNHY